MWNSCARFEQKAAVTLQVGDSWDGPYKLVSFTYYHIMIKWPKNDKKMTKKKIGNTWTVKYCETILHICISRSTLRLIHTLSFPWVCDHVHTLRYLVCRTSGQETKALRSFHFWKGGLRHKQNVIQMLFSLESRLKYDSDFTIEEDGQQFTVASALNNGLILPIFFRYCLKGLLTLNIIITQSMSEHRKLEYKRSEPHCPVNISVYLQ